MINARYTSRAIVDERVVKFLQTQMVMVFQDDLCPDTPPGEVDNDGCPHTGSNNTGNNNRIITQME